MSAMSILAFLFLLTVTAVASFAPNPGFRRTAFSVVRATPSRDFTEDPNAALDSVSISGVSYAEVLDGLNLLYPPSELQQRNAVSRTDGYWAFIKDGEEPPLEYTYGEIDLPFFAQLLDRVNDFVPDNGWKDKTFCDIGSGTGRLVISAAALHPEFKLCRGVEYLPGCHNMALTTVAKCTGGLALSQKDPLLLSPIELQCASIGDPDTFIADVDVCFAAASCMTEEVLDMISRAVATQCKMGTIVITTDYEIPTSGMIENDNGEGTPYKFDLLETMDGYVWVVGGTCTAYFYRLVEGARLD